MKIYVNSGHQIKAVRVNDTGDSTLTEIIVEDNFLEGFCDSVIKSFCYQVWKDGDGNQQVSTYPYKDFSVLETIQEEHVLQELQAVELMEATIENDYRLSMMELGLI